MGDTNYLTEHSDAELGRGVRRLAAKLLDTKGRDSLAATSYFYAIACIAFDAGAAEVVMEAEGVTEGDKECGNWKMKVEQTGDQG